MRRPGQPARPMPSVSRASPSKRAVKAGSRKCPTPRDRDVASLLGSYPKPIGAKLQALRKLILETARKTDGVGTLAETLKWGQVSYLTSETGSGSTIRIDRVKSAANQVCLYFHCQTNLVETFRELYPELRYSGNRAILLDAKAKLPEASLRHCIALALTYHGAKRKSGRKTP
jgi:hypothetical protein